MTSGAEGKSNKLDAKVMKQWIHPTAQTYCSNEFPGVPNNAILFHPKYINGTEVNNNTPAITTSNGAIASCVPLKAAYFINIRNGILFVEIVFDFLIMFISTTLLFLSISIAVVTGEEGIFSL